MKNKKVENTIAFVILLFIILALIKGGIGGRAIRKDIQANGCYMVGVTTGFRYVIKTGRAANYQYVYEGKVYTDWEPALDGIKYNGGKYLLQVSSKDPENARMYFTIPIKGDSIPSEYRPLCSELENLD